MSAVNSALLWLSVRNHNLLSSVFAVQVLLVQSVFCQVTLPDFIENLSIAYCRVSTMFTLLWNCWQSPIWMKSTRLYQYLLLSARSSKLNTLYGDRQLENTCKSALGRREKSVITTASSSLHHITPVHPFAGKSKDKNWSGFCPFG